MSDGRTRKGKMANYTIAKHQMRGLVFWAGIGIAKSNAGSYGGWIEELVSELAKDIRVALAYPPQFNSCRKKKR